MTVKDEESLENGHSGKGVMKTRGMVSGMCYALASCSMMLMNKHVLSSFGFHSMNSLLLYQTLMCVILVKTFEALGFYKLERMTWPLIKAWLPVNFIFVGMIWSSFFALKFLGVAMVTVLKNCTNLLVVVGDIALFGRRQSKLVWVSLALMLLSGVCGAATDLSFDAVGYTWQLVNCCFTAAYSLYLRFVMNRVSALTASKSNLDEFSMVLFNNLLSTPFILVLMLYFGELSPEGSVLNEPAIYTHSFQAAASLSGLLGFGISFSSLWFLHESSPTTFSLVGSLNKIPTAVAGLMFFHAPTSTENLMSIGVGLLAGVAFTQAKIMDGKK
ncbi:hypothetical protein CYMTET_47901 [Cymbomonas tetramitiformis]|uniref:Sugar phosphate transporter domain-containing protein n=1 Tax=Cymbomonas tetramitiformis TaxID=36881 RepID=A0AAE0EW94_9CHLO|nr:hypothetical protein CYMTET_47901 [Cymbomonas tetramitiformis]